MFGIGRRALHQSRFEKAHFQYFVCAFGHSGFGVLQIVGGSIVGSRETQLFNGSFQLVGLHSQMEQGLHGFASTVSQNTQQQVFGSDKGGMQAFGLFPAISQDVTHSL